MFSARIFGVLTRVIGLRETIWETPWVKRSLHGKLEEDRAECAEHLATHALRPEKFLLAKMLLHVSGRAMGWMASLFKFDHSAVDADGERLRVRETMHADSKVPAPGIWPTKEINKLIDAEIHDVSAPPPADGGTRVPDRVNIQSDDRKAAVVRDVRGPRRHARRHRVHWWIVRSVPMLRSTQSRT